RVDVSLGPEMKSTGEVLGVGENLEEALYKGFLAAGKTMSDKRGVVLATINNYDKEEFIEIAKDMRELGYTFVATEGTAKALRDNVIDADIVNSVEETRHNILDIIRNKKVDIVINSTTKVIKDTRNKQVNIVIKTITKEKNDIRDGFKIRRIATELSTKVMTSLDTLKALIEVKKKEIKDAGLEVYNIAE